MAKVTYIGGPWDGKVEVATSFPARWCVARNKIAHPASGGSVKVTESEKPPHHVYGLMRNGSRYVYVYKGES